MFKIIFSNEAEKFLKKIDKDLAKKIVKIIEELEKNPKKFPYKKLSNGDYRIRSGDIRISYSINKKELLIVIIKIGYRKNFYKNYKSKFSLKT